MKQDATDSIFGAYSFGDTERERMDRDGHLAFPWLLAEAAADRLTGSLANIESLRPAAPEGHEPQRYSAEYDAYLASLIGHPQMLELARDILGEDIRYDHCVALNRPGGNQGIRWHAHGYGEEDWSRNLGFVRIFFYVNGFAADDGGLKVVRGSHLYKDRTVKADTDAELEAGWLKGKTHPVTGEPLRIETLEVPERTVVVMWTHALHAVTPRRPGSDTRYTVVYAYRNPGLPSSARWIKPEFELRDIPGAEGLLTLY